jgi:hypothetical protein
MGLGTAFVRVPAGELAVLAASLERALREGELNEVAGLLRPKAEAVFDGWSRNCWRLPSTLELLSFRYGQAGAPLGFLRADATQAEWTEHLARLPEAVRPVASCLDVTLLSAEERAALRAAYDAAEADKWSRMHSAHFAFSPEELPFLFGPETAGVDVLVQEGDGEREWRSLGDFAQARDANAEPPSVLEDRNAPSREAEAATRAHRAAVEAAVEAAGVAVTGSVKLAVSLVYFSLCAAVPLLAYPTLLPSMLRTGDWGATAFTLGLLAAIGLLPFALVWRRLGARWRLAIFAVHAAGLATGMARFALSR